MMYVKCLIHSRHFANLSSNIHPPPPYPPHPAPRANLIPECHRVKSEQIIPNLHTFSLHAVKKKPVEEAKLYHIQPWTGNGELRCLFINKQKMQTVINPILRAGKRRFREARSLTLCYQGRLRVSFLHGYTPRQVILFHPSNKDLSNMQAFQKFIVLSWLLRSLPHQILH